MVTVTNPAALPPTTPVLVQEGDDHDNPTFETTTLGEIEAHFSNPDGLSPDDAAIVAGIREALASGTRYHLADMVPYTYSSAETPLTEAERGVILMGVLRGADSRDYVTAGELADECKGDAQRLGEVQLLVQGKIGFMRVTDAFLGATYEYQISVGKERP